MIPLTSGLSFFAQPAVYSVLIPVFVFFMAITLFRKYY